MYQIKKPFNFLCYKLSYKDNWIPDFDSKKYQQENEMQKQLSNTYRNKLSSWETKLNRS